MVRINGNRDTAEVTGDSRLKVEASAHNPASIAAEKQDAYAVPFEQDAGAVTADFFYLKNTNSKNLFIYRLKMYTPTLDNEVDIVIGVTGSPTAGTAIVPVNLYAGGKAADVACEGKDGDMALTGGKKLTRLLLDKDFVGEQVWHFEAPIILPPDTSMVLHCIIDPTADIDGTLYFFFESVGR